jgi:two-component system, OmpR family, phosphate regulon sensor histidine kinase PhoR
MLRFSDRRPLVSSWQFLLPPFAVLLFYTYYASAFIFFTPYPGIDFTFTPRGWIVTDSSQPALEIGDALVQIGDLQASTLQLDRFSVPFDNYGPGDAVIVRVAPDAQPLTLTMPYPTLADHLRRLITILWFFPFWIAGTIVLLFLQPRDQRWLLLGLFFFLIAIWFTAGSVASWQIGSSRLVYGISTWLFMPVAIHLHLVVPQSLLSGARHTILAGGLYALGGFFAAFDTLQILPRFTLQYALLLAAGGSIAILLYRFLRRTNAMERIATRLMLVGIGLAFVPGIMLVILPNLFNMPLPSTVGLAIAYIAIPVLPFFYIYAIFKRHLGQLELRINRLLSRYSFALLFPPVFLIFFWFGLQFIASPSGRTIYLLAVATIFVIATPPLYARFQRWMNRLAYGATHDPEQIVRVFASQIPSAMQRDKLLALLRQDILPSLLVRQSALYIFEEGRHTLFYTQGVTPEQIKHSVDNLEQLLAKPARYQIPLAYKPDASDWVRLAIPLTARGATLGAWLFGRRDPDDFYPQDDIDLLQSLANQIAPMVENIGLYESLQQQADRLADEVAERTAELREERDRTQAILDSAGEGVFFMEPTGAILYVNPAMTALLGYAETSLLGQTLDMVQTEESKEKHAEMWTAVQQGQPWSGDLVLRRHDEKPIDISLTLAPLTMAAGSLRGFVGVLSDISKLKEIDRLKSNIIANVSHELKTPLTNISMYLTLLKRGKPEKWDNYLSVLQREADRLNHLIQNLLDLSQLDTGSLLTYAGPIDVRGILNEVYNSYQPRAQAKGIALHVAIPPALPLVIADADQIEQVFVNLVVNAINYTSRDGQIQVSAGVGRLEAETAVQIQIADTGYGIAADEIPHLFARFFRGKSSHTSSVPGTGLGLAICKEIIDRHQGKIEVESRPGQGTTFTVWLKAQAE